MKTLFSFLFFIQFNCAFASDTLCQGKYDKDSLKNGVWKCTVLNKIVKTMRYKNGVLQNWILYNAKGEIIETRNNKGKIRRYKPCGC